MKVIPLYFLCFFIFCCSQGKNNFDIIDEFQDGKMISRYKYMNDTVSEVITYNVDTERIERKIDYIKGVPNYKNNIDLEQEYLNYKEYLNILDGYKINPFNPNILGSDLNDMANILSIADVNNDFKKEIKKEKNEYKISFSKFNKNIRFSPSLITLFIPDNTTIEGYEIIVREGQPLKEIYFFQDGGLIKEYFYDGEILLQILYKRIDKDKKVIVFEKKFEYKIDSSSK
ncbi:hypothetical protein JSO59_002510 [Riemerella anatipestifer]|uniref:hypothetical protein n=1 Tax=Riemerella anatipestifer TaxID=34085 RepID=UPI0030BFC997